MKCMGFASLIYYWKYLERESATAYVKELLQDKTNCIRYVCRNSYRWIDSYETGWSYDSRDSDIAEDKLFEIVQKYNKKALCDNFNSEERVQVASFFSNYGEESGYKVPQGDAEHQALIWEQEAEES